MGNEGGGGITQVDRSASASANGVQVLSVLLRVIALCKSGYFELSM